jgi:hypothetical protein
MEMNRDGRSKMPISGLRRGDRVFTPSTRMGTVICVTKRGGREFCTVRYDDDATGERCREFATSGLRLISQVNRD